MTKAIAIGSIVSIFFALTAWGSYDIQTNYFVRSTNAGVNGGIALTFDDGPDPVYTPQILSILSKYNIKATFFVIGKKVEKHPDLLKQIYAEGHTIGNHSFSHSNLLPTFTTSKLIKDIDECNKVIEHTIHQPVLFFRPPFGVTNPRYGRMLRKLRMTSVGWSIRSYDTVARNKDELLKNIEKKLHNNAIILLHDHLSVTTDALESIIQLCQKNSYEIKSLEQLIGKYESNV